MKVAIVTPTIGTMYLEKNLSSVQGQTYKDIVHYIFIDGYNSRKFVEDTIFKAQYQVPVETVALSKNIGKGWYGHRVYAACSFLVDADVVCFLDEDNWLSPDHIESLVDVLNRGNDWAYSLRKIFSKDGRFVCNDDCESLGKWPVYNGNHHHIDTSCFAVRREVALRVGHSWYGQWGADRVFFQTLLHYYPKFDCSRKYTLNYRLDGNPGSVTEDFFLTGNNEQVKKIKGNFPWSLNESKK